MESSGEIEHHSEDEKLISLFIRMRDYIGKKKEIPQELEEEFQELFESIDRLDIRYFKNKEFASVVPELLKYLYNPDTYPLSSTMIVEGGKRVRDEAGISDYFETARELNIVDLLESVDTYFELVPPYITEKAKIPKKLSVIYRESRLCYVLGLYNASVATSRIIIELSIKDRIGLEPTEVLNSLKAKLDKALEFGIISNQAWECGKDIIHEANQVLHNKGLATKEKAREIIEKTKDFLETTYSKINK